MRVFDIHLKELYPFLDNGVSNPVLTVYLQHNSKEIFGGETRRPCMLFCPGGAYYMVSEREGEPMALHLFPEGWQAAVLHYSVAYEVQAFWPQQLLEASAALHYLSVHAEEFHIDPEKLAITGFSAGAHLAASYANYWNRPLVQEKVAAPKLKGCTLCYGVLTAGEKTHSGSMFYLTGKETLSEEEIHLLSMEKQIGSHTPATFLFHTACDDCVPVENTLMYASALSAAKIPFEVHIYPEGFHGLSTADRQTGVVDSFAAAGWLDVWKEWLRRTI